MPKDQIKSYVMRASRMTEAQKQAYQTHASKWLLPDLPVDWPILFPGAERYVLEIGFGMGEATKNLALSCPNWAILAVEVHPPGVGKLLWWIEKENLENIRILQKDAVQVFSQQLAPASVDAIHIWFPDPWPKKKHHKRRLIDLNFIQKIKQALKVGGIIYLVTDWEDYAQEILTLLQQTSGLKNCYQDWAPKQEYRPNTKFEERGTKAQRIIREIIFSKEES